MKNKSTPRKDLAIAKLGKRWKKKPSREDILDSQEIRLRG
jgi:hypothetical protein